MKRTLLAATLLLTSMPLAAKEITVMEVTDTNSGKAYFSPNKLTIQPGDTVTFENAQDDPHEVMFVNVPKAVDEMIMSPMQNKKGEKFSYTFTVPGTYQFHCHPHEAAGMKGTLIVGAPSKAGQTKSMDHHKLAKTLENGNNGQSSQNTSATADTTKGAAEIQGQGKIIEVNPEEHIARIKHDPIQSLGWPVMTMTFNTELAVDLSGFQAGDAVTFSLKPNGNDDYVISHMQKN